MPDLQTSVQRIPAETFHGRKGVVKNAFRYSVDYLLLDPSRRKAPRFSRGTSATDVVHDADTAGPRPGNRG